MEFIVSVQYVDLAAFAFVMGSIPWGVILARRFGNVDVRQAGSKNIGATNVFRTAGLGLGILTLMGDLLKGALPVWLAVKIGGHHPMLSPVYVSAVALSAFGGHLYPLFLKFKSGGKGVATAAGCFLVISPAATGFILVFFILGVIISQRVSVGSVAAVGAVAPMVGGLSGSTSFTACALVMAAAIYVRHKENIRRLISGTEPAIWGKKSQTV
jgi:glycerol-3-phosphate acyltransferase PlsY